MQHVDDWRLTISYWPRAAEAGVRPQEAVGFSFGDSPALYRPYEIDFTNPPTRDDLHAVVARTPWMDGWKDTLLPVLALNFWPMITSGYKAACVDLSDSSGRVVGRVEVRRTGRYVNRPYSVPVLGTYLGSDIDKLLNRRIRDKAKREQAREHVEAHRHLILERLARCDDPSPTQLLDEVVRVLVEGGFLSTPKRCLVGV